MSIKIPDDCSESKGVSRMAGIDNSSYLKLTKHEAHYYNQLWSSLKELHEQVKHNLNSFQLLLAETSPEERIENKKFQQNERHMLGTLERKLEKNDWVWLSEIFECFITVQSNQNPHEFMRIYINNFYHKKLELYGKKNYQQSTSNYGLPYISKSELARHVCPECEWVGHW